MVFQFYLFTPMYTFCPFIQFKRFSRQVYWGSLPFPPPVDHILSELSAMTHPSWVALHTWLIASWHHQCNGHERGQLREVVRNREAWRTAIHGVAKSRTWLGNWTTAYISLTSLEQSLRTIWEAMFQASVLSIHQIKHNSQLLGCTFFSDNTIHSKGKGMLE